MSASFAGRRHLFPCSKNYMLAAGCLVLVLGALNAPASKAASGEEPDRQEHFGVVVEEIGEGSVLGKAGLQPGDVLHEWKRLANPPVNPVPAAGELFSYFDWLDLETEQAPRGTVVLIGERNGEFIELRVKPGLWGAEVRPVIPSTLETRYSAAKTYLFSGDVQAAVREWRSLAADVQSLVGAESLGAWIHLRIGAALGMKDNWGQALESYDDAIEAAEGPLVQIAVWEALGKAHEQRNEFEAAEVAYLSALQIRRNLHSESLGVASGLNRLGEVADARGELDRANDYFLRALKIREELAPQSLNTAESLNNLGTVAISRGELSRAAEYIGRALRIVEQLSPQSLVVAITLNNLGHVALKRLDLDNAHYYHLRALQIREHLVPQSSAVANSLYNLGLVAWERRELDAAHAYHLRALQIYENFSPNSLSVANIFNSLGLIAQARGELDQANVYFLRSLHIKEQHTPHSLVVANGLNSLGMVAQNRGELDHAHDYFLRSLRLREHLAPKSYAVASSLNNLGSVAWIRGELDRAYDYNLQTLRILEQVAPQSLSVAVSLNNLGSVAQARGELGLAEDYYLRSLQIKQKLAPESLDVAVGLNNLGTVAQDRGELDRAYNYHLQSLQIREQLAPESLDVANSLNNLGAVAEDRGELDRAYDYFLQALLIRQRLAAQSLAVAKSLNALGDIFRARGEFGPAHDYYSKALEALEHQVAKLGGSYNTEAGFRAEYGAYYDETLGLLLTQNRITEAFHALERFRAQTFLTMLAERDTTFTADVPEELDRERRRLAVRYDDTVKRLAGLNLRDHGEEIEIIHTELAKLDDEAGDLEARVRRTAPRLAALQYPSPLDAASAREALDLETLMLSYNVGEDETALFVLSRTEDLQVKILPIGSDALRSQVERLRSLILEAKPGSSLSDGRMQLFQAESRALYDALLEPVADQIAASERLLILPDGPLHDLPFAALIRSGANSDGRDQYLVEWKPLHVALSATVFAELKQQRRSEHEGEEEVPPVPMKIAAFGDPIYPASLNGVPGEDSAVPSPAEYADATGNTLGANATLPADPTIRSAAERGIFDWPSLPYTRREVEGIAHLFPDGTVHTFLGAEALEERLKSLDRDTRILHIAAHGHTDEHLPSSSFIALTIPEDVIRDDAETERDNGLLQVWEIFERVRIDADLVVLSACESALGQELGTEGLIGLTRAFQYAGARSVVASLWSVADQSTAELMIRFYRHLRSGLAKDEALRAAQIELIRGPIELTGADGRKVEIDASAPYYWAAFQVYGDWQ